MDKMKQTLLEGARELDIPLPEEAADTLCAFAQAMLRQNEVMNLTAITEPEKVARLHLLDSYAAVILPAMGGTLGLFLMKQFMEQTVHPAVLESASMDGAGEMCKFLHIVMPMVKPAWLTLMIFSVQTLWNTGSTPYIYSEQLKTLPYAMSQISAAGVARAGVSAAISVLMMLVPLLVFIITQSNIIETMSSSGMKD